LSSPKSSSSSKISFRLTPDCARLFRNFTEGPSLNS